jgi:hypothetical protein
MVGVTLKQAFEKHLRACQIATAQQLGCLLKLQVLTA